VLKISASAAFGKLHIAPAMPEFLERYPEIQVQLVLTDRFVDLAEEGFDLVIRLSENPGLNLVARRLTPIRYVVCAAPAYLDRMGMPETPLDLASHNCLFYAYESSQDLWRFEGPDGQTVVKIGGNFQVNSSEAIREALLGGLGISLAPTFSVGADLRSGALRAVLTAYRPYGNFGYSAYAVYLPNRQLAPKVRVLVDFLVERFGEVPYWDAR
jgi:DNA-binding transcriptional LysR family regulator